MKPVQKIFFFVLFLTVGSSVFGQSDENSAKLEKTKEIYAWLINKPNDNQKRFELVELLLDQNIISEARYQLSYLAPNFQKTPRYKTLLSKLDSLVNQNNSKVINSDYETLKSNPQNISAVKSAVFNFFKVEDYGSAAEILREAIEINPENLELKYLYAQTLYNLNLKEKSFEIMSDLVNNYETDNDQKLLYSRLAVWFGKDLNQTEKYLNSILVEETNNIHALISLCLLNIKTGNIDAAKEFFAKAYSVDAENPELELIRRKYLTKNIDPLNSNNNKQSDNSDTQIASLKRALEGNPNDIELRFELINEYLSAEMVNEAEIQLYYLEPNLKGSIIFESYKDRLEQLKNDLMEHRTDQLISILKRDPGNRDAAIELSEILNSNSDFEGSEEILEEYLSINPDDDEIRFRYAESQFLEQNYSDAEDQLLILLEKKPFETRYLLMSARIKIAENDDLDGAEEQLKSILREDPENIEAILNLAVMYSKLKFFDSARYYVDKANKLDPNNPEMLQLNSILSTGSQILDKDQHELLLISARKNLENENCETAAEEFEKYLDKSESYEVMIELADAYHCAGNITNEITVLHDILETQFNLPIAKRHAALIYQYGEYELAYDQLNLLHTLDPSDNEITALMGEALVKMGEYKRAKSVYSDLLLTSKKPREIRSKIEEIDELIAESRNFSGSFNALNRDFFSSFNLKPYTKYYGDNQNMELFEAGGGISLNLTNFISAEFNFGAGLKRSDSQNYSYQAGFGSIAFKPQRNLTFKTILGTRFNFYRPNQPILGALVKYSEENRYNLSLQFMREDAAEYLLSKGLTNNDLTISNLSLNAKYIFFTDLVLEGNYSFAFVPEYNDANGILYSENSGQNLILKGYRYFIPQIYAGYEYTFTHFRNANNLYFSPQTFDSHSLFAAYKFYKRNFIELIFEGKIGYLAKIDKSLKAASFKINFIPFEPLIFNIYATLSDTYRDQLRYNSGSISASIFLKVF